MEYNTVRKKLTLPEYGRHIHKMVEHAKTIETKEEKQKCVNSIIKYMGQMNPHLRDISDYKHKLWDQLFIMANFELDIDSPYDKPSKEQLFEKPERLKYPKNKIKYSYYGQQIQTMIETAVDMKDETEKEIITGMIANHMKKCYLTWSKSSVDDKTILKHLNELSEGKLHPAKDFVLIEDKMINHKKSTNKHNWKHKKKHHSNKQKR